MQAARTNAITAGLMRCTLFCGTAAAVLSVAVLLNTAAAQKKTAEKTVAKTDVKKTASAKTESVKTDAKLEKKPGILGRIFRNIIPEKPPERILPKTNGKVPSDDKDDKRTSAELLRARDHIDSRAPHDPDDIKRLQRAESLIKVGEWQAALTLLQRVMDRKDDTLIRNDNEKWVAVREQASHLLANVPKEILEAYQLKYGADAGTLFDEAKKSADERALAEVATRYFHTTAGLSAAKQLCLMALDRGEFGVASRWFARVMESTSPDTRDPNWMLQAAYAFRRAGDIAESERILKDIEAGIGTNSHLMVGGKSVRPAEWLRNFEAVEAGPREVVEWRMIFGTPSRTGTVVGGDPLLLSRWSHPTTNSHAVIKQLESVVESLNDLRRAQIPASFPLSADGKIIYRTLRGVTVVDAETGRQLWETREGVSAERLLTGRAPRSDNYGGRFGGGFVVNRFGRTSGGGSPGDHHQLTGLAFNNGVYGMLSSDGRQLFVIEDIALLSASQYGYGNDPEQYDPYRRSWTTNKLTAYDLESGRPNWEIGGRKRTESFDLPLAGNFFFGVPVASNGELFVIGEEDSRIRLHALDAKTGKPKWSKLIAYSDTKISQDPVRRWFVAQPTISQGVVICPTGVGWMVAVDRSNQAILWAHRYSPPQKEDHRHHHFAEESSIHRVQPMALNARWTPSAPVVSAGHVVYTPLEDDAIICLRLRDGKQLWRIPQEKYLYLAGVFDEQVVLVGQEKITAVKLQDGVTSWSQPIDGKAGKPSGLGVATGGKYHIPLKSGQLWTLDLKTGKVLSKMYRPAGNRPLGNLTMYNGQVLSLTPFGLTSFEQRSALMTKIKERRAKSPDDAWAGLKEAEIALLHREHAKALTSLRKISSAKLDASVRPRYRQAMVDCLTDVIRSDFTKHDDAVKELETFAKSVDEKFAFRRLQAERFDARNDYESAFALYQRLADEGGHRFIQREDNRRVELTVEAWVAGKLRDLWDRVPRELRKNLDSRLQAEAKELAGKSVEEQMRFGARFAFHPVSATVITRLADRFAADGQFGRAEQMLLRLQQNDEPTIAAAATEHLARLLQAKKLPSDSHYVYDQLRRRYPKVVLPNGKSAADHVADLETRKIATRSVATQPSSWGDSSLRIEETGTQYESQPDQELIVDSNPFPFFQEHSFQIDHNAQQLMVTRTADQSLSWLVPLRARQGSSNGYYVFATATGHQLLLQHQGVLHCLSPVDRRVLWTKPLDSDLQTHRHYFSYYSTPPTHQYRNQAMQSGNRINGAMSLERQSSVNGGFAFANENYIGISGRRRLVVLDARTGETVWTYRGVGEGSYVVGTSSTVFIVPGNSGHHHEIEMMQRFGRVPDKTATAPTSRDVIALRAVDGKEVTGKAMPIVKKAVAVVGDCFLVADVETKSFLGFSRSTTTWKLQHPLTGAVSWKREYGTGTAFTLLEDGSLAALKKKGVLEIVDCEDGQVRTFQLPARSLDKADAVHVLTDRDSLFVIANDGRSRNYYNNGGLSMIPVNGEMYAVDRTSGKLLWEQKISNENLITDQFSHSPILTLSTRKYINKGLMRHMSITLLAIDKRTGKRLLETERASNQYYGSFTVNVPDRYVEFRTYSSRMRLIAEGPAAAIKPNAVMKK